MPLSADGWFDDVAENAIPRRIARIKAWQWIDETYAAVLAAVDPGINSYESVLDYPPEEINRPTLQPSETTRVLPEVEDVAVVLGWQPTLAGRVPKVIRGGAALHISPDEASPEISDVLPYVATFQQTFFSPRRAQREAPRAASISDVSVNLADFNIPFETVAISSFRPRGLQRHPAAAVPFNTPLANISDRDVPLIMEIVSIFSYSIRRPRGKVIASVPQEVMVITPFTYDAPENYSLLSYSVMAPRRLAALRSLYFAETQTPDPAEAIQLSWLASTLGNQRRRAQTPQVATDLPFEAVATLEQTVGFQPWQVVSAQAIPRSPTAPRESRSAGGGIPITEDEILLTWMLPTQRPQGRARVYRGPAFFDISPDVVASGVLIVAPPFRSEAGEVYVAGQGPGRILPEG